MRGISHIITGAATGVVISQKFNMPLHTTVGFTIVGSIIVDIDSEDSLINRVLTFGMKKYRNIIKLILGAGLIVYPNILTGYLGAIIILSAISGKVEYRFSLWSGLDKREYHRIFFHCPFIGPLLLIVPLIYLSVPRAILIPYIVGLTLHYILDMFTAYGLPLYIGKKKTLRMPLYYNSRNFFIEGLLIVLYVAGLYYFKLLVIPYKLI